MSQTFNPQKFQEFLSFLSPKAQPANYQTIGNKINDPQKASISMDQLHCFGLQIFLATPTHAQHLQSIGH
jgi:hypothetical protein